MNRLLAGLVLSVLASGQTTPIYFSYGSTGNASPGKNYALTLNMNGGTTAGITTLQWTTPLPAGATGLTVTAIQAGTATCGPTACLFQATSPLVDGAVATVAIHFSKAAAGEVPVGLSQIIASNGSGLYVEGIQVAMWVYVK